MLFIDAATRARGDLAAARRGLEETVAFAREHDLGLLPAALLSLSDAVIAEGNLDRGRALCEELLSYPDTRRVAELNLAHVEMLQGRYSDAERLTRDALTGSVAFGDRLGAAWAATGLACALAKQGELEAAGPLLGAALSFFERAGARLDWMGEVEEREVRTILEANLDHNEARALIEKGRGLSLEQVAGATLVGVPQQSSLRSWSRSRVPPDSVSGDVTRKR
jgi:tetratricopeptide (TPR) repeat protein